MRYAYHLLLILLPSASLSAEADSPRTGEIDWDLLLKALGIVVAVVAAYFQLRNLNFAARASLKTDLEILKLLDSSDPNHQSVKMAVDKRISDLYAPQPIESSAVSPERWALAIIGLLWALGFSYWTIELVLPTFSWWALLTGYLAFAGVGFILMGASGRGIFRRRERPHEASGEEKTKGA